jgi:tetratricopeptide (TPR) repeat protein
MKRVAVIASFALALGAALAAQGPDALKIYLEGRSLEAGGNREAANLRYKEAIEVCRAELALNPRNMDSYTVMMWSLFRQGLYAETIAEGLNARKQAEDGRVLEIMGEAYFYLGNYAQCIAMMQRSIAIAPFGDRVATAYFFKAEAYMVLQKLEHAEIAYSTACNMEGGMPRWWYRLALCRERLGLKQLAKVAVERSLGLNPSDPDAIALLERLRQ